MVARPHPCPWSLVSIPALSAPQPCPHPSVLGQYTVIFRSIVTKKRRESTHARNSPFKFPSKMRACADSRRFFVTTDLKIPVSALPYPHPQPLVSISALSTPLSPWTVYQPCPHPQSLDSISALPCPHPSVLGQYISLALSTPLSPWSVYQPCLVHTPQSLDSISALSTPLSPWTVYQPCPHPSVLGQYISLVHTPQSLDSISALSTPLSPWTVYQPCLVHTPQFLDSISALPCPHPSVLGQYISLALSTPLSPRTV